jgi:hypothetical protein
MNEYINQLKLLGIPDQNLPVFKEARVNRLKSIDKMTSLINIMPRLTPKFPNVFILNQTDPEWDDKMVYPTINHAKAAFQLSWWGAVTGFFAYNWNVIAGNKRLSLLKLFYPVLSTMMLSYVYINYNTQYNKVHLFEMYCEKRAKELVEENKYLFDHDHFKRYVYFQEDMKETLERVHRQANNHNRADFMDSELIVQDFIKRHSTTADPSDSMFFENGDIKMLN